MQDTGKQAARAYVTGRNSHLLRVGVARLSCTDALGESALGVAWCGDGDHSGLGVKVS